MLKKGMLRGRGRIEGNGGVDGKGDTGSDELHPHVWVNCRCPVLALRCHPALLPCAVVMLSLHDVVVACCCHCALLHAFVVSCCWHVIVMHCCHVIVLLSPCCQPVLLFGSQ